MEYQISIEDQAIRKNWLITKLDLLFFGIFQAFYETYAANAELFIHLATQFLVYYLIYYCAYRKMGTKLLTFYLITEVISLPFMVIAVGFIPMLFMQIIVVITTVLMSLTVYFDYKLRLVNKKIRREKAQLDPDYQNGIKLLQECSSLEDLKIRFSQI